jgi:hypothetical protein
MDASEIPMDVVEFVLDCVLLSGKHRMLSLSPPSLDQCPATTQMSVLITSSWHFLGVLRVLLVE